MSKSDLVAMKRVANEVGVSRVTLWRASKSGIEGFPAPTVIRRMVYWKREEIARLAAALKRYRGRVAFEGRRNAEARIATVRKLSDRVGKRVKARTRVTDEAQADLFTGGVDG